MNDESGRFLEFFKKMGSGDAISLLGLAEEFVCSMYGLGNKTCDVNEARFLKLLAMSGPIDQVYMTE